MLICADCGRPLQTRQDPSRGRATLVAALSLIGIVSVAGGVLLLNSIHDSQLPNRGAPEASEAGPKGGD